MKLERRVLPSQKTQVRTDLQRIMEKITAGEPVLVGDRGPAVAALQRYLSATGIYTGPVSGTFDQATDFALRALQKKLGLAEDGSVDADDFKAIKTSTVYVKDGFETAAKVGQAGSDILAAEKKLEKLGYRPGKVDGVFDAQTEAALQRFRKADKETPDKGTTLGAKAYSELSKAAHGYDHDPLRRRQIVGKKGLKQHQHLDDATAKAAKKGLALGATGKVVENLERHLEAAGYDLGKANGTFGSRTEAAVKAFQRAVKLPETGIVDAATWQKLRGDLFAATSGTSPAQRLGEVSGAVKKTEKLLNQLHLHAGKADGTFTENTEKAVERFQKKNHLKVTGQVGGATLKALQNKVDQKLGVTLSQLHHIMPNLPLSKAKQYLPLLNKAMHEGHINTRLRKAAFLAQIAEESIELKFMEEIASGSEYEGRTDLGNTHPGDGVRYKGRGPIQLTGRANYRAAGHALHLPLEQHPTMAARPSVAFRTAVWFWNNHGLNALADRRDFLGITHRINGGENGESIREMYYRRALGVLK